MLYNQHHYSFPELFSSTQTVLYPLNNKSLSPLSHPQPQVIFILFSVSINFPILGTSHKQNHTMFVILCLAYFTQHNVFKKSIHYIQFYKKLPDFSPKCTILCSHQQWMSYSCFTSLPKFSVVSCLDIQPFWLLKLSLTIYFSEFLLL